MCETRNSLGITRKHTVEDALNVDIEDIIPALLFRKVVERRAPRNTRVVDEDMQLLFPLLELSDERVAACLRLYNGSFTARFRLTEIYSR